MAGLPAKNYFVNLHGLIFANWFSKGASCGGGHSSTNYIIPLMACLRCWRLKGFVANVSQGPKSVPLFYHNGVDVRYSYCCRQDDSIVPEKKKGQYDGFFVDLRMCHKLRKHADHGDSDADDNEVKLGTVRSVFTVNRSEFLAGEKLKYLMYTCLPLAFVPDDSVKDSIVDKVHRFGCSMLDLGLKPLPLLVDVGIRMSQLPGESEDEGIARATTEMDVWDYAPAAKASIGALEEVAFDGLWPVKECEQCSKTLAVGKLVRMPCAHVFHWQCIYTWLAGIHMCLFAALPCPADFIDK